MTRYCTQGAKTGRYCWKPAGHDGLHGWEYCQKEWGDYTSTLQCELPAGHEGQHHAEVNWT